MHPSIPSTLLLPYSDHDSFPNDVLRGPPLRFPASMAEHPLGVVVDQLKWNEVQCLAATSSGVQSVVHEAIRTRFKHLLRNWVEPVDIFMRLMEETGSVFVGDFVTAFLVRDVDPWWNSVLQISCPDNPKVIERLITFFEDRCEYVHWHVTHPSSDLHEVRRIYTSSRDSTRSPFNDNWQHIQIIRSSTSCSTTPVPRMWNSALVSYISSTEIVAAYPRSAFQRCAYISPSMRDVVSSRTQYAFAQHRFLIRTYRARSATGNVIIMHPGYGAFDHRAFDDPYCFRMRIHLGRDTLKAGILDPRPIHRQEHARVSWQYSAWSIFSLRLVLTSLY